MKGRHVLISLRVNRKGSVSQFECASPEKGAGRVHLEGKAVPKSRLLLFSVTVEKSDELAVDSCQQFQSPRQRSTCAQSLFFL